MAGILYHSSVDPIVPDANRSLAPEIILKGLAGMAQMTVAREKMQLESEQMATDAMLKSRQLDIARENNQLDYQIEMKNADALADYRRTMAGVRSDEIESRRSAMQDNMEFKRQLGSIRSEAKAEADSLRLFDPEFQAKNPVEFAANVEKFDSHWSTAPPSTGISAEITKLKRIRDQQKITLPFADKKRTVPIWQVAQGLQDDDTHDLFKQALIDSGHLTTTEVPTEARTSDWRRPIDTLWDKFVKGKPKTRTVETPDSITRPWVSAAVDFRREPSRVEPFMAPSARTYMADQIFNNRSTPASRDATQSVSQNNVDEAAATATTQDALLPVSEPLFPPTETDKILATARRYYNMPGADKPAIRARLQDEFHIDPTLLDSPTSPSAQPTPTVDSALKETDTDRNLRQARNALKKGADRAKVIEMLQAKGIDPSQL